MNTNYDLIRFMTSALKEARIAYSKGEVPVGAVVVKNGKIIGRGYNQRERLNDPTAHAEIIAITAAANSLKNWRLTDCKLFITKEPCSMCAGAIVNARIPFVCFGAEDRISGCCGSVYQLCRDPRFNHQSVIIGKILQEECQKILTDFFNLKRKSD